MLADVMIVSTLSHYPEIAAINFMELQFTAVGKNLIMSSFVCVRDDSNAAIRLPLSIHSFAHLNCSILSLG